MAEHLPIAEQISRLSVWLSNYSAWAAECVQFKPKAGGEPCRHDTPHPGQLKLREPYKTKKSVRVALKARQVGSTFELASQKVFQAMTNPGQSILVLAQTFDGVRGISDVYAHIVEHLPPILRTSIWKAKVTMHRIHWEKLNSEIVFSTANTESIRGVPRQGGHITEAAFVENLGNTLRALLPTCHGPMDIESTANGPGTFHELWNDPHIEHVFIRWTDDATCVSDEPLPDDLSLLEVEYIKKWDLSLRQAQWFVPELRKSDWTSWRQEHPMDPEEAFVLSGDRFFQVSFFPQGFGDLKPLQVYEKLKFGHKYAVGVDCSGGSKQNTGDYSAAVVLDVTNPSAIKTVCAYRDRIPPKDFAKILFKISELYHHPVMCVERNGGWGLAVLTELRGMRGLRLYRGKAWDKIKKLYEDIVGWNTTEDTRKLLLSNVQNAVNHRHWVPEDPRIENDCNAFRYNEEGRPEAAPGCFDDFVFAGALALQAATQAYTCNRAPPEPPPPPGSSWESIAQYEMRTGDLAEAYDPDED